MKNPKYMTPEERTDACNDVKEKMRLTLHNTPYYAKLGRDRERLIETIAEDCARQYERIFLA